MAAIRWLHLTDFHVGSASPTSWPSLRAKLEDDLTKTLGYTEGPLDLVLFTGDLVQRGAHEEYEKLDEILEHLWETFGRLGSNPVLFAVPGNHDLVRPAEHLPAVRALLRWKDEPELSEIFWDPTKGEDYREILTAAFASYTEWMQGWRKRHPLPQWVRRCETGKLPGDFAATVEHNGIKFGIIGLNSAFLHLAKRTSAGDLTLDPRQFYALCDNDPRAWAERHDVNVLMSHHPPEWLSDSGIDDYKNNIYQPGWFAAHLCGHLHVARAVERSIGGAQAERLFQGTALLGEMEWEGQDGKRNKRIVGYGAARIERKENHFELRIWPRLMVPGADGRNKFAPDSAYSLDDDRFAKWTLPGRSASLPYRTSASTKNLLAVEPAGRGYSPNWYVPPPHDQERTILANLETPGTPIVLMAPPLLGKSTYLQRIVDRLREQDKQRARGGLVLVLDLGALTEQAPDNIEICMRELAELLVEQYATVMDRTQNIAIDTETWVNNAWDTPSQPERKLRALLKKHILSQPHDRIVLVIDRFDRLGEKTASLPVARLLRYFSEEAQQGDADWAKIRIILATTGSHALLRTRIDAVSELFSVMLTVRLEPFGLTQLEELRSRYHVDWSEDQLKELQILTGGWPFLSRQILYLAATGIPVHDLLDEQRLMTEHCTHQLQRLWLHVCEYDRLRQVVCALLNGGTLGHEESQMLRAAGLVRRKSDGLEYEIASRLVETYFKARCCGGGS